MHYLKIPNESVPTVVTDCSSIRQLIRSRTRWIMMITEKRFLNIRFIQIFYLAPRNMGPRARASLVLSLLRPWDHRHLDRKDNRLFCGQISVHLRSPGLGSRRKFSILSRIDIYNINAP